MNLGGVCDVRVSSGYGSKQLRLTPERKLCPPLGQCQLAVTNFEHCHIVAAATAQKAVMGG